WLHDEDRFFSLEAVRDIDHTVVERVGTSGRLLDCFLWIGDRSDKTEYEIVVETPVHVPVELIGDLVGGYPCRGRLIEQKVVKDEAGSDGIGRLRMHAQLVRDQVRIGDKILAGDLALPPGAPVVEAGEQAIE